MSPKFTITILIAEDNSVSRDMMASIMKTQGYRVIGATDGGEAIDIINNDNVDMAFVDVNMAPKGGFEFVKYLVAQGIDLPVAIVTANTSNDILVRANELGVKHILHKPVNPDRMLKMVHRILKSRGIETSAIAVEEHHTKFTPDELMKKTIEMAQINAISGKGGPYAAIITNKAGEIFGTGVNGASARTDPTAHAEVMAIRQAAERTGDADLSDYILYCSSEPTTMGQALIASVGIREVNYGLSHEEVYNLRESKRKSIRNKTKAETQYKQLLRDEAYKMYDKVLED